MRSADIFGLLTKIAAAVLYSCVFKLRSGPHPLVKKFLASEGALQELEKQAVAAAALEAAAPPGLQTHTLTLFVVFNRFYLKSSGVLFSSIPETSRAHSR